MGCGRLWRARARDGVRAWVGGWEQVGERAAQEGAALPLLLPRPPRHRRRRRCRRRTVARVRVRGGGEPGWGGVGGGDQVPPDTGADARALRRPGGVLPRR